MRSRSRARQAPHYCSQVLLAFFPVIEHTPDEPPGPVPFLSLPLLSVPHDPSVLESSLDSTRNQTHSPEAGAGTPEAQLYGEQRISHFDPLNVMVAPRSAGTPWTMW